MFFSFLHQHAFIFFRLFVSLTHSSSFPLLLFSTLQKRDKEEKFSLICALTDILKAREVQKHFSSLSCRWWTLLHVVFETTHVVHLLRVNDHPGLKWTETDNCLDQKFVAILYSFLCWAHRDSAHVHIHSRYSRASLPHHPGWKINIVCVAAHFMLGFPHLFPDLQILKVGMAHKYLHPYLSRMKEVFVLSSFQSVFKGRKQTLVKDFKAASI